MPTSLKALWVRAHRSAMLYGALSTAVRVGANLILIPILLHKLSEAELAVWWVFVALGAIANLADFGFGQAITRVYNYLWAGAEDFDTEGLRAPPQRPEPNLPRLRQLAVTVRRLYWWVSGGSGLLLAVGGSFFLYHSSQLGAGSVKFWVAWAIYLVSVIYSLGTSHWTLACQGLNRVRDLQAANMWGGILYVASAALLLLCGAGLFATVVGTALRGWLIRELCRRACYNSVPDLLSNGLRPEMPMLRRLWPNAWKFGLLSVGAYLMSNVTVLICSHLLEASITASVGLTAQIGLFLVGLSTLWLTVKWPEITILRTQGRLEEMARLFARRLALCALTFLVLSAVLVVSGNRLLEWKGTHTRLLATPFLLVYLLFLGQQLIYGQFGTLTFTKNVVLFHWLSLATGLGLIGLSVLLTRHFGLWGLISAPLVIAQTGASWYPIWRGFRSQPLSVRQFLGAAIGINSTKTATMSAAVAQPGESVH